MPEAYTALVEALNHAACEKHDTRLCTTERTIRSFPSTPM